jgi:hypothetical protein
MDVAKATSHEWYFMREELENSPSIRDGMSLSEESIWRKRACSFVKELGKALNLYPHVLDQTTHKFMMQFLQFLVGFLTHTNKQKIITGHN